MKRTISNDVQINNFFGVSKLPVQEATSQLLFSCTYEQRQNNLISKASNPKFFCSVCVEVDDQILLSSFHLIITTGKYFMSSQHTFCFTIPVSRIQNPELLFSLLARLKLKM